MKRSPRGFTAVEGLLAVLLISGIFLTLFTVLRSAFSGTQRGSENLNILQEESIFLEYLKHDLRTLIFSQEAGIPPPEIINDGKGTTSFAFFKVETVDAQGRPLPVKVVYTREDSGRTFSHPDGSQVPVFGISRKAGTANPKTFVKDLIATFALELLDKQDQLVESAGKEGLQKVRISLKTASNELFKVVASIYSPYLKGIATGPADCWYPNYLIRPFTPKAIIRTYEGVEIEPEEFEIIPGANGISLLEEW